MKFKYTKFFIFGILVFFFL